MIFVPIKHLCQVRIQVKGVMNAILAEPGGENGVGGKQEALEILKELTRDLT
jgi:hypothetical protein